MTSAARQLVRGPAEGWTLVLVAAVVVALTFTHQLAGSSGLPGHLHGGDNTHVASTAGDDRHAAPCSPTTDCPGHPHGHHGQACQAQPGPTPTVTPPLTVVAYVSRTPAVTVTPSTVDRDAGDGTGCGPPSRAHLAVWRI